MSLHSRRKFLQYSIAAALGTALPSCAMFQQKPKRPNILFVIADEWRAQAFGFAGDKNAVTPALDRFHSQSVTVDNAVAGLPVCSPMRASFLTGQYPLTNGVYLTDVELKPKRETLAEVFAKEGYQTGYIGKWHLYGSPKGVYERRNSYIPPESRFGFQYWKGSESWHTYNHSLYFDGNDPTPKYWQGYDAIAQTDDAIDYIHKAAQSEQPYFLVLSWGPPHFPYSAPEKYNAMYKDRVFDFRPNVPPARREEFLQEMRGYYAAIAALDDCFAKLMAALDASGTAEDTIVVFTSDHGDMLGSQGMVHKHVPWDESVRVPFMLRYPHTLGTRARTLDAHLNSPDIMPTLLGLANIAVPEGLQGVDYSAAIRGDTASLPDSAFISMPAAFGDGRAHGFAEYRGVRTDRYTYIRSINGPWLLYDNVADPYQMRNLIDRPEAADIQQQCELELQRWLERLGDAFLPGDDYLRRDGLSHYHEVKVPIKPVTSPWGDWHSTMVQK